MNISGKGMFNDLKGETFRLVEEGDRRVTPGNDDVGLQEAPPTAVTSEAEGYISDSQAQGVRLCPSQQSSLNLLSLLSLQQHLTLPVLSAHDGSDTSLSSLEQEAVRTRGHPWDYHGADWGNLKQY